MELTLSQAHPGYICGHSLMKSGVLKARKNQAKKLPIAQPVPTTELSTIHRPLLKLLCLLTVALLTVLGN